MRSEKSVLIICRTYANHDKSIQTFLSSFACNTYLFPLSLSHCLFFELRFVLCIETEDNYRDSSQGLIHEIDFLLKFHYLKRVIAFVLSRRCSSAFWFNFPKYNLYIESIFNLPLETRALCCSLCHCKTIEMNFVPINLCKLWTGVPDCNKKKSTRTNGTSFKTNLSVVLGKMFKL